MRTAVTFKLRSEAFVPTASWGTSATASLGRIGAAHIIDGLANRPTRHRGVPILECFLREGIGRAPLAFGMTVHANGATFCRGDALSDIGIGSGCGFLELNCEADVQQACLARTV
jgi:hypothetical protein